METRTIFNRNPVPAKKLRFKDLGQADAFIENDRPKRLCIKSTPIGCSHQHNTVRIYADGSAGPGRTDPGTLVTRATFTLSFTLVEE